MRTRTLWTTDKRLTLLVCAVIWPGKPFRRFAAVTNKELTTVCTAGIAPFAISTESPSSSSPLNSLVRSGVRLLVGRGIDGTLADAEELEELEAGGHRKTVTAGKICVTVIV
jgi:hypothetical protein